MKLSIKYIRIYSFLCIVLSSIQDFKAIFILSYLVFLQRIGKEKSSILGKALVCKRLWYIFQLDSQFYCPEGKVQKCKNFRVVFLSLFTPMHFRTFARKSRKMRQNKSVGNWIGNWKNYVMSLLLLYKLSLYGGNNRRFSMGLS